MLKASPEENEIHDKNKKFDMNSITDENHHNINQHLVSRINLRSHQTNIRISIIQITL